MVTIGLKSSGDIPIGVTRRIDVPHNPNTGLADGDVKYVTPDAKLTEVWDIVKASVAYFGGLMGVSVEAVTQGSQFSSGFQLKLSKTGVIDRNIDKQGCYREPIRSMLSLAMQCATIYGTKVYPYQAQIMIDYAEMKVDSDPLQQEQIWAMKLANKTADQVMLLMLDNPDLSEADAIELANKINTRTTQSAVVTPEPVEL
jgi:hypothetical protein